MQFKNILLLPWRGGYINNIGVESGPLIMNNMYNLNNPNTSLITLNHNNLSNKQYHKKVFETKKKLDFNCLTLGGDHSIAIGSVLSSINKKKDTGVIWIDAHPDINTIKNSKTKRVHGMPLSFITGLEKSWKWTNSLNKLHFNDLYFWGIRSIDNYEKNIIKKNNIFNTMDYQKIIEICDKYDNLHISLDIDAIDPRYMPSTGTPVKKGLNMDSILLFVDYLKSNKKNVALDIVEFNPEKGSNKEKQKTHNNLNKIISCL